MFVFTNCHTSPGAPAVGDCGSAAASNLRMMGTTLTQEASTRRSILEYLKKQGSADVRGIAEFCALTTMAVGRHLLRLRADGLIETKSQRPSRGRPAAVYSLTEQGDAQFPRDYAALTNDLLRCVAELDGREKVRELFRKCRRVVEQRFKPKTDGKPFERRVRELAEVLTECGYMAEVEQEGREFLLIEHNCAIRNVAECFPEACEEELILIKNLAEGEVCFWQLHLAHFGGLFWPTL